MKIASDLDLTPSEIANLLPATVTQIIDLAEACDDTIASILGDGRFDVLITRRVPTSSATLEWSRARRRDVLILIRQPFRQIGCIGSRIEGAVQVFFGTYTPITVALTEAERIFSLEVTAREALSVVSRTRPRREAESVLVVGAGAVGLMTAFHLLEAGYAVQVVDAYGDPRCRPDWKSLGCTHGGGNARMFSLTECDNYHDREASAEAVLHSHLSRNITDFGWLIGRRDAFPDEGMAWVKDSLDMPIWLAERYNEDIFTLSHESLGLWREMMKTNAELFHDVELYEPLLRIASNHDYHIKQLNRQRSVEAYIADLSPEAVIRNYPALSAGVRNGEIAGAIEVTGFTVNVHHFANRLIDHLERRGVNFCWGKQAGSIVTESGFVKGITVAGELQRSDNYFVSPGVYAGNLLRNTRSDGKIHGVLGAWMTIPNIEPCLRTALKIARDGHIASSGNIIPGRDDNGAPILMFGSGFGYLGDDPSNIDQHQLDALFSSMEDYLASMFPDAFRLALADGSLRRSRKYCVRPWTASSLGTFEIKAASTGMLIIASGHNTGGFAQSPAIGRATLDALQGRVHPMHVLYHPQRYEEFWLDRGFCSPVSKYEAVAQAV